MANLMYLVVVRNEKPAIVGMSRIKTDRKSGDMIQMAEQAERTRLLGRFPEERYSIVSYYGGKFPDSSKEEKYARRHPECNTDVDEILRRANISGKAKA